MKTIKCYFKACECTEPVTVWEQDDGLLHITVADMKCPHCGRTERHASGEYRTGEMEQTYPCEIVVAETQKAVESEDTATETVAEAA